MSRLTLYKTCIIMTYASDAKMNDQNKFLCMESGCSWYVRNLDLQKDFKLESLKETNT